MFSKLLEHGTYMSNFLTYRIAADKIEVFSVQKLDVSLPLASVDICALQILTAESESGREPSITSLPIATHCKGPWFTITTARKLFGLSWCVHAFHVVSYMLVSSVMFLMLCLTAFYTLELA
jgi:hypothetical protein